MDIDRLRHQLSAEPDVELAFDLFGLALRAGASSALAEAVEVMVSAPGVSRQQLQRCAERLAAGHRERRSGAPVAAEAQPSATAPPASPPESTAALGAESRAAAESSVASPVDSPVSSASDSDGRALRQLVHALVRRGVECTLTVRTMTLDLDMIARLVDMPAVHFQHPIRLSLAWDPTARDALLLDAAERAVEQLGTLAPYDDAPAQILAAVRAHWGEAPTADDDAGTAADDAAEDASAAASARSDEHVRGSASGPSMTLDEAWSLADELSTSHAGVDDMGWGLRSLIEGQGTQALESFRNVRGSAARADIWRCFDRDGSTIVRSPSDPSLEAAFDAVDRDVPRWEERDEERDGMAQARFDFLFGQEPHAGGAVDEVHQSGFALDGRDSRRERACARAEALAHEQELEWQVERALRALLAHR